jgi:hypothetical protein
MPAGHYSDITYFIAASPYCGLVRVVLHCVRSELAFRNSFDFDARNILAKAKLEMYRTINRFRYSQIKFEWCQRCFELVWRGETHVHVHGVLGFGSSQLTDTEPIRRCTSGLLLQPPSQQDSQASYSADEAVLVPGFL